MAGKIKDFLREFQLILSIILTIIGIFVFFMGVIWHWFQEIELGFYTSLIHDLGGWNTYLLIVGFIILMFGAWYLYSFFKNRKFLLEEIETNKRSELLKKHAELKITVKHLPSKYQKMLKEKEEELKIK